MSCNEDWGLWKNMMKDFLNVDCIGKWFFFAGKGLPERTFLDWKLFYNQRIYNLQLKIFSIHTDDILFFLQTRICRGTMFSWQVMSLNNLLGTVLILVEISVLLILTRWMKVLITISSVMNTVKDLTSHKCKLQTLWHVNSKIITFDSAPRSIAVFDSWQSTCVNGNREHDRILIFKNDLVFSHVKTYVMKYED